MSSLPKPPIINCHTHVFTGRHVPPHLAKSIIPAPFYKLVNFQWLFRQFAKRSKKKEKNFGKIANDTRVEKYKRRAFWYRNLELTLLSLIPLWYLTVQSVGSLLHWSIGGSIANGSKIFKIHEFLQSVWILLPIHNFAFQIVALFTVLICFKSGRNLIWWIARQLFSFLGKIPGKQTKALLDRYFLIARYTSHLRQSTNFSQLSWHYPAATGFVLLPMDMQYMDAGEVPEAYDQQMSHLITVRNHHKQTAFPFIFIDPRRLVKEKDYFVYSIDPQTRQIILGQCKIKTWLSEGCYGFKIYPALGYYPCDPLLLPLWKFAIQESLPIMTHCVKGHMYFRGTKSKDWDRHPIFEQMSKKDDGFVPLLLPELKNNLFTSNFTNPLNFACLLKPEYLALVINFFKDEHADLVQIFDWKEEGADDNVVCSVGNHLMALKICLGHYGGEDEWLRYLESESYVHNNAFTSDPYHGIELVYLKNEAIISPGKPEQLWKYTDWYSIISSLSIQHENVYADISYILHSDAAILPLLKQTLHNKSITQKVLYGTDFFVVRNHKSDKHMLADMLGGLTEKEFDQIARYNPRKFLNLPDYPPPDEK